MQQDTTGNSSNGRPYFLRLSLLQDDNAAIVVTVLDLTSVSNAAVAIPASPDFWE